MATDAMLGGSASAGPLRVCLATARAQIDRTLAYVIEVVRWPLYPAIYFCILLITYRVSGRESVAGVSPEGFLVVGTFGMVLWSSAVWTGGYAIEWERSEGTILSLFLTPASRGAVVIGYELGSLAIFVLPTIAVVTVLGFVSGAEVKVTDPLAVVASALALLAGTVAMGYVLAGAFVLTRRANMIANFIQSPIYLLSGMVVPVDDLPEVLQWFAYVFPISAGMNALRDTLLAGAGFGDIAEPLARFVIVTAGLFVLGHWLLGRVEHVAKRGDQLDFD
jgi:ABC-2 type transport system permease protein